MWLEELLELLQPVKVLPLLLVWLKLKPTQSLSASQVSSMSETEVFVMSEPAPDKELHFTPFIKA